MKKALKIIVFRCWVLLCSESWRRFWYLFLSPEEELRKLLRKEPKRNSRPRQKRTLHQETAAHLLNGWRKKAAYNIKASTWDQTPAEQGLKVGDWVTIVGYTGGAYRRGSHRDERCYYGLEVDS